MIRPDLDQLGRELQGELRLRDWQITYAYVSDLAAEDGSPVYGLCSRNVDAKTAVISIRDPLASQPLPDGAEDKPVEAILMHELVHLHMAPLAVNTPQGIVAEEQAVWPLADALARWRGSARGEMVARAMSLGARRQRVGARPTGSRSMNRSELAMLKAAMGDGKDPEASMKNMKAAIEAYEKTMPEEPAAAEVAPEPPSEESEEAKKARLARAVEAEEEERKKRAAAAPAAAMALSRADVRREAIAVVSSAIRESEERAAILRDNAPALGHALVSALASQPLVTVKMVVAARLMDAPKDPPKVETRAAGVGPLPPPGSARQSDAGLPAEVVARMDRLMGTNPEPVPAMRISERGGVELSHLSVETVGQQIRRMSLAAGGR